MVYSTEQLDRISELAALLTPISDMAVLLDVDADTLRLDILDRNSPVSLGVLSRQSIHCTETA